MLNKEYRPGRCIYQNAYLLAYEMDDTATTNIQEREHIDFEHESYKGEKAHPTKIIVKENEKGAYGIGHMRQWTTNRHVKVDYATKHAIGTLTLTLIFFKLS